MEWLSAVQRSANRLAGSARSSLHETQAEFQTKGFGGVMREAWDDTGKSIRQGADSAISFLSGDDFDEEPMPRALPSRSGANPRGPVWKPPVIEPPPRLEDLQKGTKVYRKGGLAEVVKIDREVDPPSLVVRMLEGGNEVGTEAVNLSLDAEASARCHAAGVRIMIVELQGRKELNGRRGSLFQYKADVKRWNVTLDSSEVVSVKPKNLSVLLRCPEVVAHATASASSSSSPQRAADVGAAEAPRQPGHIRLTTEGPIIKGGYAPASSSQAHPAPLSPSRPPVQLHPDDLPQDDNVSSEQAASVAASFLGNAPQEVRMPSMRAGSSAAPPASSSQALGSVAATAGPEAAVGSPASALPDPVVGVCGLAQVEEADGI